MLDRLCRPGDERIERPFAVDGWAVGCDGRMMLAIRGGVVDDNPMAPVATVRSWLVESPSGVVVSLADLRSFAGEPVWESPCDECDGTGRVSSCFTCQGAGDFSCECDECGNTHRRECPTCAGDGKGKDVECESCRGTGRVTEIVGVTPAIEVAGVPVDPRRLTRLLACVPDGETVQVAALDHQMVLALWGDGWQARLMMMRNDAPARKFAVAT